jgi:hypothetical protein
MVGVNAGGPIQNATSASVDADIKGAQTEVRVFGKLDKIGSIYDSDIPCTATIGWLLYDGANEANAKLTGTNMATNFLSNPQDDFPVGIGAGTAEGVDALGGSGITINNAVVSNYSATMSVGDIPSAECTFLGSSMSSGSSSGSILDLGNGLAPVVKPQDITVSLSGFSNDAMVTDACWQSVTVDASFARENVRCLGSAVPLKFVQLPIVGSMTLSGNVQAFGSPNLAGIADGTRAADLGSASVSAGGIGFTITNAIIANQSVSIGLDDALTIELTLEAEFGGANSANGISIT